MTPRVTLPLFMQTLGLVIATLIAAQIATVVVIFSLPAPAPEIYTVGDVVQGLRSAGAESGKSSEAVLTTHFGAQPPGGGDPLGRHRVMFRDALARSLGVSPTSVVIYQHGPRIIAFGGPHRSRKPRQESSGPEPLLYGRFQIGVHQPDGRWLLVEPRARFGFDPWQERLLLVSALAALAVSPLAWAFSRRLAAPFSALAASAERLGRDPGAPPLDIGGSAEVAAAVAAFNEMQKRLRRYVDDRTTMIGAIAHDLRTPLTRLRFRIEAIPEPLRSKLEGDVDQMEAMVASTLSFVRDAATPRDRRKLEVASLVETVMDAAPTPLSSAPTEWSWTAILWPSSAWWPTSWTTPSNTAPRRTPASSARATWPLSKSTTTVPECLIPRSRGCSSRFAVSKRHAAARPAVSALDWRSCAPSRAATAATSSCATARTAASAPA
jgi:hypothetical protein